MPEVGYRDSSGSPNQVCFRGSFATNDTAAPDGVRGRFEVARTGVGVFTIKMAADPNAPAGAFTEFQDYFGQAHGTTTQDNKLYEVRVTAEDATLTRPILTVTVYIKTYAAGAIDTYVAAETNNMRICFDFTLLKATAF